MKGYELRGVKVVKDNNEIIFIYQDLYANCGIAVSLYFDDVDKDFHNLYDLVHLILMNRVKGIEIW